MNRTTIRLYGLLELYRTICRLHKANELDQNLSSQRFDITWHMCTRCLACKINSVDGSRYFVTSIDIFSMPSKVRNGMDIIKLPFAYSSR
nr:AlNc14C60G4438 [Albugo laibachii Nc14]|eukprot:CCA18979.1 AlNc14C60G4438 [Albugo laibachii Nc14]